MAAATTDSPLKQATFAIMGLPQLPTLDYYETQVFTLMPRRQFEKHYVEMG